MKGEKETEREYQDLLGCHQGLEGSQTCHASCSDPGESPSTRLGTLVLPSYQFALCTSNDGHPDGKGIGLPWTSAIRNIDFP